MSQGFIAGVSSEGIQHDAPVGAAFQGGPLVNSAGEVLGVASRAYAPLGFAPEAVFFGVPDPEQLRHPHLVPRGRQPAARGLGGAQARADGRGAPVGHRCRSPVS